jgi:hypothetical protein
MPCSSDFESSLLLCVGVDAGAPNPFKWQTSVFTSTVFFVAPYQVAMNEQGLNRKATGMNEIIQTKHSFRERCAATQYSSNYEPPTTKTPANLTSINST